MTAARESALDAAASMRSSQAGFRRFAGAIAATLLIAAIITGGSYWWMNRPDDYRTAPGERRVVTLV